MFNELVIEAVRTGKEQITDDDVETWKPVLERVAFLPERRKISVSLETRK